MRKEGKELEPKQRIRANQRVRLLLLYELLSRLSDEEHPLSTKTIIKMMSDQGFPVSKVILPADVCALNCYGYEVLFYDKDGTTYYYVREAKLDSDEIRRLLDLMTQTKIPHRIKRDIYDNLVRLARGKHVEFLARNIIYSEEPDPNGYRVVYNLDTTEAAVRLRKKVSFTYYSLNYRGEKVYDKEGEYILNPLIALCDRDIYYLVAYEDGPDKLLFFRLDRIEGMKMLKEKSVPYPGYENPKEEPCREKILSALLGDVVEVRLRLDDSAVEKFFDRYGEGAELKKSGDEYRAVVNVRLTSEFFSWIASAEGGIKIEKPREASERFSDFIWGVKTDY